MEHKDVVRLNAAEKYVLGELSDAQRDEYEEHYFDCPTCAEELKATFAFMESAKDVARGQVFEPVAVARREPGARPERSGFFAWLRPAFAVSALACAALLVVIGYQNGVTIPQLRQAQARAASASFYKAFSLPAMGTRGEGAPFTVSIRPSEAFTLDVDMPGNSSDGYFCRIQDEAGRVRLAEAVSAEQAKNTVHFLFPTGSLNAGKYTLYVFKGQAAADDRSAVASQLFVVEFVP